MTIAHVSNSAKVNVKRFDNPFDFYNMHLMVRNHIQIKGSKPRIKGGKSR